MHRPAPRLSYPSAPTRGIPVWAVGWVDVGIDPYGTEWETRRFFDPHTVFQYRL